MNYFEKTIDVRTHQRNEMIDITSQVQQLTSQSKIQAGIVTVFCPHTTAAITINENADPDVPHDILLTLEQLIPKNRSGYRHDEGNSDAHLKSSIVGASETILLSKGHLNLGTWQGIFFCEFDGPRSRTVKVQIMGN